MSGLDLHLLFSPQSSTLPILEANLTKKRRAVAERLIESIATCVAKGNSRYDLVIGPRGAGKTHLLKYVELSLREQMKEKAPRIIRLSEEELGVTTHTDILLAALLAVNAPVDDLYDKLSGTDGHTLAEARLLEVIGAMPALLIMENLANLLEAMKPDEHKKLRSFLQRNANISVLAASPRLLEGGGRADHPFYNFFLVQNLKDLTNVEARDYLIQLAQRKGDTDLVESLSNETAQARVNAICALTGGNHRLIGMLAEFLCAEDLKTLVQPLVRMIDRELTPYYQARLADLPNLQAKIIRVIARAHMPLTVKEIARLSVTSSEQTISSQLRALRETGLVRSTQHGRESYYELNEPLMRLVLDIKESRERLLPSIVALLRDWYEASELRSLADRHDGFSKEYYEAAHSEKCRLVYGARGAISTSPCMAEVSQLDLGDSSRSDEGTGSAVHSMLASEIDRCAKLIECGENQEAIQRIDEVLLRIRLELDSDALAVVRASAHFEKAHALYHLGQDEDALNLLDEMLVGFSEFEYPDLSDTIVLARLQKSSILRRMGRYNAAREVDDETIRRFQNSRDLKVRYYLGNMLLARANHVAESGDRASTIAAYNKIIDQFGSREEALFVDLYGEALFAKGNYLLRLREYDSAISIFDELVSKLKQDPRDTCRHLVAKSLINKIATLNRSSRHQEALLVCEEVASLCRELTDKICLEYMARMLVNKMYILANSKRHEQVVEVFDELESLAEIENGQVPDEALARALVRKADSLVYLKRGGDAAIAYNEVISRFSKAKQPALLLQVTEALIGSGIVLRGLGKMDEAVEVSRQLIRDFAECEDSTLKVAAAFGVYNLIKVLIDQPARLRAEIEDSISHETQIAGLTNWVRLVLPLDAETAQEDALSEHNLREAFAGIEGADRVLDIFSAARAYSLGDKKALLRLPLESRRLVEEAYGLEVS